MVRNLSVAELAQNRRPLRHAGPGVAGGARPQITADRLLRPAGHYLSRCTIPADFLNEGRFVIGVNASSYRVRRYFQDEKALTFTVDAIGAPGMQWPEPRMGAIRPRLDWQIEVL